jgi:Protein of unknown function (DUF3084)
VLSGIAIVVGIAIVAGGIAYIGDRVGHQVGRKRMTLFGLRPKYTSTIVAVATGMLIALSVTLVALIGSSYVRTAFFRIGQLNSQINQLQAQAVAQERELNTTRNANIAFVKTEPMGPPVVIDMALPEEQQMQLFSRFFDETIRAVNQIAPQRGLLPTKNRSTEPKVRADLLRVLRDAREHFASLGDTNVPVLFLPIAPANLFRGETITFSYGSWADKRLYAKDEEVASIDVEGGRALAAPDYQKLQSRAFSALALRGMPYPFFGVPSGFDPARFSAAISELARVRGHFRLVARSDTDLYPHSGQFNLSVTLDPRR